MVSIWLLFLGAGSQEQCCGSGGGSALSGLCPPGWLRPPCGCWGQAMGYTGGSCPPPLPITSAQSQLLATICLSGFDLARGDLQAELPSFSLLGCLPFRQPLLRISCCPGA